MSKDVKSLPGEGIGWGWEGEAGRQRLAKSPVRGVSVTSVLLDTARVLSGTISELKMNCSQKMCRND